MERPESDDGQGRGHRYVIEDEAAIICQIFEDYDAGKSPKSIAHALNHECVPGPKGGHWSPSTIYGNWRRGTGILNNELYIGKMVWNRQHFVKDPQTGKRQARLNPEEKWVTQSVPDLQIINTGLWQSVKARQLTTRQSRRKAIGQRSQDGQDTYYQAFLNAAVAVAASPKSAKRITAARRLATKRLAATC